MPGGKIWAPGGRSRSGVRGEGEGELINLPCMIAFGEDAIKKAILFPSQNLVNHGDS